jgi:RNA polymerase sigma factor (sigma-70 family)
MSRVLATAGPGERRVAPDWSEVADSLRRVAFALTRSADEADDLTQETLATLLARRADRPAHAGYARQTLIRLWLDRQRSLRRRLRRMARLARVSERWHADRDRVCVAEQHERVRRAIAALPPRQQAVLVLRVIEGISYDEISRTLDCSVEAVRASLHLARRRVRRTVGEPG